MAAPSPPIQRFCSTSTISCKKWFRSVVVSSFPSCLMLLITGASRRKRHAHTTFLRSVASFAGSLMAFRRLPPFSSLTCGNKRCTSSTRAFTTRSAMLMNGCNSETLSTFGSLASVLTDLFWSSCSSAPSSSSSASSKSCSAFLRWSSSSSPSESDSSSSSALSGKCAKCLFMRNFTNARQSLRLQRYMVSAAPEKSFCAVTRASRARTILFPCLSACNSKVAMKPFRLEFLHS